MSYKSKTVSSQFKPSYEDRKKILFLLGKLRPYYSWQRWKNIEENVDKILKKGSDNAIKRLITDLSFMLHQQKYGSFEIAL